MRAEVPPEGQRLTQRPFLWDLSVEGGPEDWVWPVCGSLSRLRCLGWSVNGWLQGLSRPCSWSPRSTAGGGRAGLSAAGLRWPVVGRGQEGSRGQQVFGKCTTVPYDRMGRSGPKNTPVSFSVTHTHVSVAGSTGERVPQTTAAAVGRDTCSSATVLPSPFPACAGAAFPD